MTEQFTDNIASFLVGDLSPTATVITVTNPSAWPTTGSWSMLLDSEHVRGSGRSGGAITVTRGAGGTSAAFHANNTQVKPIVSVAALTQFAADVEAVAETVAEAAAEAVAAAALTAALVAYLPRPAAVRVTHASGTTSLVARNVCFVDVSGGAPPTINAPDGAVTADLDSFDLIATGGDASVTNIVVTAVGSGWSIEDPGAGAPGTFSPTATIKIKSAAFTWLADLPNKHWKLR